MNRFGFFAISLVLGLLLVACGDHPDVEVSFTAPKGDDSTYTFVRVNANLLREKPKTMMDRPNSILMLNQGDQIQILEMDGDWVRIQHVLTGKVGWLNKSFIQRETRSKWWSGDTDRARNVAEMIYKDKIFMEREWPIVHINIEERWNKLVYSVNDGIDFSKDDAIECARFAMQKLVRFFPDWKDHQVFIDATWNGKSYTLAMGDDQKENIF